MIIIKLGNMNYKAESDSLDTSVFDKYAQMLEQMKGAGLEPVLFQALASPYFFKVKSDIYIDSEGNKYELVSDKPHIIGKTTGLTDLNGHPLPIFSGVGMPKGIEKLAKAWEKLAVGFKDSKIETFSPEEICNKWKGFLASPQAIAVFTHPVHEYVTFVAFLGSNGWAANGNMPFQKLCDIKLVPDGLAKTSKPYNFVSIYPYECQCNAAISIAIKTKYGDMETVETRGTYIGTDGMLHNETVSKNIGAFVPYGKQVAPYPNYKFSEMPYVSLVLETGLPIKKWIKKNEVI